MKRNHEIPLIVLLGTVVALVATPVQAQNLLGDDSGEAVETVPPEEGESAGEGSENLLDTMGESGEAEPEAEAEAEAGEEETNLLDADVEEEENLLDSGPGEAGLDGSEEGNSFGATLEGFGLEAEISGYGETVFYAKDGGLTFDMWHFVPIIGVQIGDTARAEIEIEFEHGGDEIKVEYAFFDYTPWRALSLRVGKFNVPFGYFNAVLHPSFRWNQINRPAMMNNVVPATWSEVGAQLYGRAELGPTAAFEYNLFFTNGLGYEADKDLTSESAFVRKFMRENNRDNNVDKAVGGRLGLRVLVAEGLVRVISGLSFYTSAVDEAGSERISILDYDVWVQIGDFMIRGEVAQSFWTDASDTAISPLERGAYLQLAYTYGKWTLAARWDNTFIKPGMGPVELHNQIVPTLRFSPDPLWSLRAEVALPLDEAYDEVPRIDFMLSFSF